MTIPQLELALKRSAELLSATEKDRDQWKTTAGRYGKEVARLELERKGMEATIEIVRQRAQDAEGKLLELGEGLQELRERFSG